MIRRIADFITDGVGGIFDFITGGLGSMAQVLINGIAGILGGFINLLPKSPFVLVQDIMEESQLSELLAMLAWVVPFPQIIALLQAWIAAIGSYYVYMSVLRWMRMIG